MISTEWILQLKKAFPTGTRIELLMMDDPYARLKTGDRGTVAFVDDIGTVHVDWDCGSTLGVIPGVDRFFIIADVVAKLSDIKNKT